MRIAFDCDGVLADFIGPFIRQVVKTTGKNLFLKEDARNPPDWNFHLTRGYTKEECKPAFDAIATSHDFWLGLHEEPGCSTLRMCILDLMRHHDIYFVTNRMGKDAKWQTEQWLMLHLNIERPTVLISAHKGLVAKALSLDCYIDDNLENAIDVGQTSARTYLLNRSYNQADLCGTSIVRVNTVGEFIDKELVNL